MKTTANAMITNPSTKICLTMSEAGSSIMSSIGGRMKTCENCSNGVMAIVVSIAAITTTACLNGFIPGV